MTTTAAPIDWRVGPAPQRSVAAQIASLTPEQRAAFEELKAWWASEPRRAEFDDGLLLRLIRASPGATKFNVKTASRVAENLAKWHVKTGLLGLTIRDVRAQLESNCLLYPGIRDNAGHQVLFMRPGLFFPGKDSLDDLVRSHIYLLQCLTEDEETATTGLTFVADMGNPAWGWSNWGVRYAKTFFDTMQGRYPIRCRRFIILGPPSWFGACYSVIKTWLSAEFAAKVVLPKKDAIHEIFPDKRHLPTEFGGDMDLNQAMRDFIKYRYKVENLDYDAPYSSGSAAARPGMTVGEADMEEEEE